eukprot:TRINITY_DN12521_c2_g1_i9.p1 TRINITY_DN12521_c2_g1~~TRINITY_DN12521_c2_g1_i9.p1  ORF type:complete len:297 (+),score=22.91 TRINITY_DN12521_c2_g1_i9:1166-2056(+)
MSQMLHTNNNHLGFNRTYSMIRSRYYWRNMYADAYQFVMTCDVCQRRKVTAVRAQRAGTAPQPTRPFQVLVVDFLTAQSSSRSTAKPPYVLTITDVFTRYCKLVPCADQTANCFVKAMFQRWIGDHGWPERIHSDNGGAFINERTIEYFNSHGVDMTNITPLNPQGNAIAERINKPVLDMLSIYLSTHAIQPGDWINQLQWIQLTLNSRSHPALDGYTPLEALHGLQYPLHDDIDIRSDEMEPTVRGNLAGLQALRDTIRSTLSISTHGDAALLDKPRFHPGQWVLWKRNPSNLSK